MKYLPVVAGVIIGFFVVFVYFETSPLTEEKIIEIYPGETLKEIAVRLEEEKVIRNSVWFLLWSKLTINERKIKAGEYLFKPGETTLQVIKKLAKGRIYLHRLTVPEGFSMYQIAPLLEKENICSASDFLELCKNKEFLRALGIPVEAPDAEGYLFPETYFFARNTPPAKVIEAMVKKFWEKIANPTLQNAGIKNWGSLHRWVVISSIVEKEAKVEKERPLIAAVFLNRLRRGMKLQADPTVLYALGEYKSRKTNFRDIKVDSPYNTYRYKGLPPGAICNPGLASLKASAFPADVDYLYFVARDDGTHEFTKDFKSHWRAKYRYQILPRQGR